MYERRTSVKFVAVVVFGWLKSFVFMCVFFRFAFFIRRKMTRKLTNIV